MLCQLALPHKGLSDISISTAPLVPLCVCRVTQTASAKAYLSWLQDRASKSEQEAGFAKAQVIAEIDKMQKQAEVWARRARSLSEEAARLREELLQYETAAPVANPTQGPRTCTLESSCYGQACKSQ